MKLLFEKFRNFTGKLVVGYTIYAVVSTSTYLLSLPEKNNLKKID